MKLDGWPKLSDRQLRSLRIKAGLPSGTSEQIVKACADLLHLADPFAIATRGLVKRVLTEHKDLQELADFLREMYGE